MYLCFLHMDDKEQIMNNHMPIFNYNMNIRKKKKMKTYKGDIKSKIIGIDLIILIGHSIKWFLTNLNKHHIEIENKQTSTYIVFMT